MSLYKKLSQNDKNMIDAYISTYASRNHANLQRLLRYWDTYKGQYLYKMFGEQFTLSKEIEWNMPKSKIMNEMYMLFNRSNSAAYQLCLCNCHRWASSRHPFCFVLFLMLSP